MNNNELTILLLLKGRDEFTIRWFEHAKYCAYPINIIVADGGREMGLEGELNRREYSKCLNYTYIRYPYDEDLGCYYNKVINALELIDSKYVIFASNDDFYMLDELLASVKYLNENPSFVAARGEIWDFSMFPVDRYHGKMNYTAHLYGKMGGFSKLFLSPTMSAKNATSRTIDFSLKFNAIWHDVIKTEVAIKAYNALLNSKIRDFRFAEQFLCFYVAACGDVYRGDRLYMLHQSHPDTVANIVTNDTVREWVRSDKWQEELDKFLIGLAEIISEIDGVDFNQALQNITKTYFININFKTLLAEMDASLADKTTSFQQLKNQCKKNEIISGIYAQVKNVVPLFSSNTEPVTEVMDAPENFNSGIDDIAEFIEIFINAKKIANENNDENTCSR